VESPSERWEGLGIWSDFGLDRHHSIRFGCIQRIFGAWLQAAAQEERR